MEYTGDYSRSVAKNSFWYLDTDGTTVNTNTGFEARKLLTQRVNEDGNAAGNVAKNINVIIPLNRYSFFEELNDKMLVPMQLQFNIELNSDDELLHTVYNVAVGLVVVNRFLL